MLTGPSASSISAANGSIPNAAGHAFFRLFTPATVERLLPTTSLLDLPADTVIFHEGDQATCVYLVQTGYVRIVKTAASGASQELIRVGPNGFFGEYGVLDNSARSATAITETACRFICLPQAPLLQALNAMPSTQLFGLLHHILDNLRQTTDRYAEDLVHRTKMSLLGGLLNTILHDFRNPFSIINMTTGILRETHPDDAKLVQHCALIEEQISLMNNMAEDVLDYSRGLVRMERAPLAAGAVFARFKRLNQADLQSKQVVLDLRADDVWIMADANKIQRVLQNLANNAAEMFGPDGGRIAIHAAARGPQVEISVADNGPGIPEVVQQRLFKPFVTAGKAKGIGLGLAIVKSIVESHGGTVMAETSPQRGTTFRIELPRCNPDGTPWQEHGA